MTTTRRAVATTLEPVIERASVRQPMKTADSLSSATFERVVLDGAAYVVKRLSYETDWVMRVTADTGRPRVVRLWESGTFDLLPDGLDTLLVDVAFDPDSGVTTLLSRDATGHFCPTDGVLSLGQHRRFLADMAALHASTWGWRDELGLCPPEVRRSMLSPRTAEEEGSRPDATAVPAMLGRCWQRLAAAEPAAHATARSLALDPAPLVRALSDTPRALVHGDWKAGNLGTLPDGRTLLIDWAFPGADAPLCDLAWYLSVNCDLLPEGKDDTIAAYRRALEGNGVVTAGWWDRQLALALLTGFVQMGWSKAEQPDELGWWVPWVHLGAGLL